MKSEKKKSIVISASMAIMAVHAMGVVAHQSGSVVTVPHADLGSDFDQKIDAALSKRSVKAAVSESFKLLATKFSTDDIAIAEKYFPGAPSQLFAAAEVAPSDDDFTDGSDGCYSAPTLNGCYANCHSACHSACHGSRSWR
jgi:hypothetical protein